jgi:hypothetical protein
VAPAHAPPVQAYEDTAGLQAAVKVEVDPELIDAGVALRVQVGSGVLTVTVAFAAVPVPT